MHLRFFVCREDRIRTCDHLVPNQAFYRTELLPDAFFTKATAKLQLFFDIAKFIYRKMKKKIDSSSSCHKI